MPEQSAKDPDKNNGVVEVPSTEPAHDARLLGLESKWDISHGLSIISRNTKGAYNAYQGTAKNAGSDKAVIPEFHIQVNGKTIDNQQEEYPLLSFRDVTYFPLTWRFAVGEFGWDYQYSAASGLNISTTSQVLSTEKGLPAKAHKNLDGFVPPAYKDGYAFYFGQENGNVNLYRLKVDGSSGETIVVSNLSNPGYSGMASSERFEDRAYISYPTENGDWSASYELKDNGQVEAVPYNMGDLQVESYKENLSVVLKYPVASMSTEYPRIVLRNNKTGEETPITEYYSMSRFLLSGDNLYFNLHTPGELSNEIYQVNLADGSIKQLLGKAEERILLKIVGDTIYYQEDQTVKTLDLKTNTSSTYIQSSESHLFYHVLGNKIYYKDGAAIKAKDLVTDEISTVFTSEDDFYFWPQEDMIEINYNRAGVFDLKYEIIDLEGTSYYNTTTHLERSFFDGRNLVYLNESGELYHVRIDK